MTWTNFEVIPLPKEAEPTTKYKCKHCTLVFMADPTDEENLVFDTDNKTLRPHCPSCNTI